MSPQPPFSETGLDARLAARMLHEWLWTTAALLALTFGLAWFADELGVRRLENTAYDRLVGTLHLPPSSDIVIIAIDDSSIEELGFWPWRRALHAQLLPALATARAVGMDLLFSERNPAYPADDDDLAAAIKAHGRIVLPLMINNDGLTVTRPLPELQQATANTGYINILVDDDSVVRSFVPHQSLTDGRAFEHFSLALLDAGGDTKNADSLRTGQMRPLRIAWSGTPGAFKVLPYARVLDGSVPASVFDGKYVLVGSWGSGLGDTFSTPRSKSGEAMAGVEILANILSGGLSGTWIQLPGRWTAAWLGVMPVLLSCLAFRRFSPQRAFLLNIAMFIAVFAGSAFLLHWALWWISPVPAALGILLAYPVWSWRSQHAALRHIDAELAWLDAENRASSPADTPEGALATVTPSVSPSNRSLLARVGQLHQALEQIRAARRQRDETLRFLSHDMRAPLNSILALTQLQQNSPEQYDHYARKTLALVDGFVELSRAEAIPLQRVPLNLATMISHCCDDAWARAQQKAISVDYEGVPGDAWVLADPGLLERAWSNLLDNALKYSDSNTRVHCSVRRDGPDWVACIQDQGRGMDAESLQTIFAPFQRLSPDADQGAGLGLAFVQTVVARHGGHISVDSQPGRGTRFCIRLAAQDYSGSV